MDLYQKIDEIRELTDRVKELEAVNNILQNMYNCLSEIAESNKQNYLNKIERLEQEQKQIAEKAFNEGQTFTKSKYDCFDNWYEDNIK